MSSQGASAASGPNGTSSRAAVSVSNNDIAADGPTLSGMDLTVPLPSDFDESLLTPLELEDDMYPFVREVIVLQQNLRKSRKGQLDWRSRCENIIRSMKQLEEKRTSLRAQIRETEQARENGRVEMEALVTHQEESQSKILQIKKEMKDVREEIARLEERAARSSDQFAQERQGKMSALENELERKTSQRDAVRAERAVRLKRMSEVTEKLESTRAVLQKLMGELAQQQAAKQGYEDEIRSTQQHEAELKEERKTLQTQLKVLQERREKLEDDCRHIAEQNQLTRADAEQRERNISILQQQKAERISENAKQEKLLDGLLDMNKMSEGVLRRNQKKLTEAQTQLAQMSKDVSKKRKKLKLLQKEVTNVRAETEELDGQKRQQINRLEQLKEVVLAEQAKANAQSKLLDTCSRERDVLNQKHVKQLDEVQAAEVAVRINKSALKNIKNEYLGLQNNIRNMKRFLDRIARDREAHLKDLERRKEQRSRAEKRAEEKNDQASILQKRIFMNEAKLKQQNTLLETHRSEQSYYRKVLTEQKSEKEEKERRFNQLRSSINRLKQQISDKHHQWVAEHFAHKAVSAEIEKLKRNTQDGASELERFERAVKKRSDQIQKLSTIISDADEELRMQTKQYNGVVGEQRVLNQQLVKRNEELAALYEQLKVQQSVLHIGEETYKHKRQQARQLAEEKSQIEQMLAEVGDDASLYEDFKVQIRLAKQQLEQEQLKVAVTTEEMGKSINVHRWKRLEDTDKEVFDMIMKVHSLQKQLIKKSSQVERKEDLIQQKEKLYVDLRRVLSRQPGREAPEKLQQYESTLKEKNSKFQQMKAELHMYRVRVDEYKFDLGKLNQELQLLKLEYFASKRQRASSVHEQQAAHASTASAQRNDSTRLAQGGMRSGERMDKANSSPRGPREILTRAEREDSIFDEDSHSIDSKRAYAHRDRAEASHEQFTEPQEQFTELDQYASFEPMPVEDLPQLPSLSGGGDDSKGMEEKRREEPNDSRHPYPAAPSDGSAFDRPGSAPQLPPLAQRPTPPTQSVKGTKRSSVRSPQGHRKLSPVQ